MKRRIIWTQILERISVYRRPHHNSCARLRFPRWSSSLRPLAWQLMKERLGW